MMTKAFLSAFIASIVLVSASLANQSDFKTMINPGHLANTTQFGYSQATVVSPNAPVIYVAGQIGVSDDGPNDFESQVDRSFDNLVAVLQAAGGRVENVVKITLLVKNMDEQRLKYLVAKRRAVFGENPPASTLIPVPELALPTLEFEIDAIAVTDQE